MRIKAIKYWSMEACVALCTGVLVVALGVLVMSIFFRADPAIFVPADPPTVIMPQEDDPAWDCARHGNQTCSVDGVLMTSVDGLPSDPFDRCVFLLRIAERVDPDGVAFSDQVCGPIRGQLG